MLVAPLMRSMLITRLRSEAMMRGPLLVRIWERSSSRVTSRTFSAGRRLVAEADFPRLRSSEG